MNKRLAMRDQIYKSVLLFLSPYLALGINNANAGDEYNFYFQKKKVEASVNSTLKPRSERSSITKQPSNLDREKNLKYQNSHPQESHTKDQLSAFAPSSSSSWELSGFVFQEDSKQYLTNLYSEKGAGIGAQYNFNKKFAVFVEFADAIYNRYLVDPYQTSNGEPSPHSIPVKHHRFLFGGGTKFTPLHLGRGGVTIINLSLLLGLSSKSEYSNDVFYYGAELALNLVKNISIRFQSKFYLNSDYKRPQLSLVYRL